MTDHADPRLDPVVDEIMSTVDADPRATEWATNFANRVLAAADKAATITTVEELDALPVGASILHDEGFQKLPAKRSVDDGHWYVTGSNEYRRAETLIPARVIHWGTE